MTTDCLAYSVPEAVQVAKISRTELYRVFQRGEIVPRKRGVRTIILADDLKRWLAGLPAAPLAKAA